MFVRTKSSLLKNKNEDSCETIVFKKRLPNKTVTSNMNDKIINPVKKDDRKMDIKKLRYEIIKFGSSGFDGSKKEESRVALAVALGAKPPKRKCKNYVEILAEKKADKEKGEKAINNKSKKGNFKRKRFSGGKTSGLLNNYGKVKPNK